MGVLPIFSRAKQNPLVSYPQTNKTNTQLIPALHFRQATKKMLPNKCRAKQKCRRPSNFPRRIKKKQTFSFSHVNLYLRPTAMERGKWGPKWRRFRQKFTRINTKKRCAKDVGVKREKRGGGEVYCFVVVWSLWNNFENFFPAFCHRHHHLLLAATYLLFIACWHQVRRGQLRQMLACRAQTNSPRRRRMFGVLMVARKRGAGNIPLYLFFGVLFSNSMIFCINILGN